INGWSASPDVIPNGINIEPDPQKFVTQYETNFGGNVIPETDNYIYLRGLNTTAAPITSRAYFYHTKGSLAMWPGNWSSDRVTYNREPRNWVDISAPANGVGVGGIPLVWKPEVLDPKIDHYCVIGWVVNGANPQPPDFPKYDRFQTFDDLVQFILAHHNM